MLEGNVAIPSGGEWLKAGPGGLSTDRAISYPIKLTNAEKRQAMDRAWTLSAVVRVEDGPDFVGLDFAGPSGVIG